jgi:hypothetical protein
VTMQQVQLTDRMLTFVGDPDPPPNLSQEHFDTLHIGVAAFGSSEVKQGIEDFREAADKFFLQAGITRTMQQQGGHSGEEYMGAAGLRDSLRQTARDRFDELEAQINSDLATL